MRDPISLWRDLGARRFLALQVQLAASVSQYLFAPILWSFWLLSLGLPHPMRPVLDGALGGYAIPVLFSLFVASELLNLTVAAWAVRGKAHRHLWPFVPTLHLYFPLGCLAAWKAIYEVVAKPFYWDKTQHGLFDGGEDAAAAQEIEAALIPISRLAEGPAVPPALAKAISAPTTAATAEPVQLLGRIG